MARMIRQFIFESYDFDRDSLTATFRYSFDGERKFVERVVFADAAERYDEAVLDRALWLAFMLIGASYYKAFPTTSVRIGRSIDEWQARFFDSVYQEGMSQFAFENNLTRADLAHFEAGTDAAPEPLNYKGQGMIALQSGGKDSLLLASLLLKQGSDFQSLFISSTDVYPKVIDEIGKPVSLIRRSLDKPALRAAVEDGGLNGHVPVTYMVAAIALVQAILQGRDTVLFAIGHEGEEPHEMIGDLPAMHQWSKTWAAERQLNEYIQRYVSSGLRVGSPLRPYSELRVAELFAAYAWQTFGHEFSSCNIANYMQGQLNEKLTWCGHCPKCANNFLLFAPFVEPSELAGIFHGQNLFEKPVLIDTFRGLLGIDGVMKPFECVGEIKELRLAYHMAQDRWGKDVYALPFDVPASTFDYRATYDSQGWAARLIDVGGEQQ